MERVEFIEHKGKKIVILNFTDLVPEDLAVVVEKAEKEIRVHPPKSLCTLTKVDGARFNNEVISILKEFAKGNEPYVEKGAIVGLEGLQRLVLTAVSKFTGRDFAVCKTVNEAKERLAGSA